MVARFVLCVALLWMAGPFAQPAFSAEAKRYALVVGIKYYPGLKVFDGPDGGYRTLDLANPENDAAAVAGALTALGYTAQLLLGSRADARRDLIAEAWSALLERVTDSDTVLFYFAGHGIELKGRNFLVPQDARFDSRATDRLPVLTRDSIDFQTDLLERLGKVQSKRTGVMGVFIIDACRENPFRIGEAIDKDLPDGLKAVLPPREVFVMYSAGIQQKALDGGPGATNSVYAERLLSLLGSDKREWPLSLLAQTLRLDVYLYANARGHLQTPAYYDQLTSLRGLTGASRQEPAHENPRFSVSYRGQGDSEVLIDCRFCPEVVAIPRGRVFKMGSAPSDPDGSAHERPQIKVRVSSDIAVGRFEVTNSEWDACVRDKDCPGPLRADAEPWLGRLPVTDVSWAGAHSFVTWVSKVTGQTYRLPTEGEWEYAARAPEQGAEPLPYFFGSSVEDLCDYANGADQHSGLLASTNVLCDDGVGREVAPVGLYKPNAFGLFDVSGNVWEWVQDCWAPRP